MNLSKIPWRSALVLFAFLTLAFGLLMRWDAVNGILRAHELRFVDLRHAHSHAGFYGLLTLGWWWTARHAGQTLVSPRLFVLHMSTSAIASLAFAALGYKAPTIALSTLIAAVWLLAGWRQWRQRRAQTGEWLDCAWPGLLCSVVLIPVIAATARRAPDFSRDLAHVFILLALLTVFIPAAWQAIGMRRRVPVLSYVALAACAAAHVVFVAQLPSATALLSLAYVALLAQILRAPAEARWRQLSWWLLPLMFSGVVFVPALRSYVWRIAGLHLLILGPLAASLMPAAWLSRTPRSWQASYLAALLLMLLSIVMPDHLWPTQPALATAMASSLFVMLALASLLWLPRRRQSFPRSGATTKSLSPPM